jgi:hypothetical protein
MLVFLTGEPEDQIVENKLEKILTVARNQHNQEAKELHGCLPSMTSPVVA